MSNLLRDAIVDAKALREAALKNAETTVIDKYSEEVRQTLNQILEQDDLGLDDLGGEAEGGEEMDLGADLGGEAAIGDMGAEVGIGPGTEAAPVGTGEIVAEDIPLAATDDLSENEGENLERLPAEGEEVNVEINLDALQEAVQQMQNEQEVDISEEDLQELLSDDEEVVEEEAETDTVEEEVEAESAETTTEEQETELSEELINSIVEELTVDLGAELSGWAGRPSSDVKHEMERELARRRSTEVAEELKDLKKAQEELVFENNQLKQSLEQHKQAVTELKEGIHDVNLSNARLLYTNRVLRNTSLNERQKSKIADAISKAGSVTEAKTIYQTLESTVESSPRRGPQSLSEAIGGSRTSVIRASRRESTPSDPHMDRMKRLAGIK